MVSLLTNCNDSVFEQKMAWWVTWYEFLGWCITTSHWRDLKTFKSKNLRAHLTKLHISTQSLRKPDLEMGESLFSHLNYCHKVSQWNIHRNISWYLHRNSKTRITCPLWCVVPSSHIWAGVWDLYDFCNGIYPHWSMEEFHFSLPICTNLGVFENFFWIQPLINV